MTYDDLEKKISAVLQEPDTALINIKPVLEEIKTDYVNLASLTEKNVKNELRIKDLQDTNMKLFLAQTGKTTETEPDEDELTGQDAVNAFMGKILKED